MERDTSSTVEGMNFDLYQPHFLLLASGTKLRLNSVGMHDQRAASDRSVYLTEPGNIEPADASYMVMIHGSLMIAAWIGFTSIGIFLARHYKEAWTHKTCGGKDPWFLWHSICMVLTLLLTIAGVIVIFVDYGEWRTSIHAILGLTVIGLVVLQPISAIFRPSPLSESRPIFNSIHFFMGNVTHVLAIITIFYAVPLAAAVLPEWMSFVIIAFVVFYLFMHVLLNVRKFYFIIFDIPNHLSL